MGNSTIPPNNPPEDFQQFLQWETVTRDVLDVKRVYIDLAGDLAAGVALSEIVYWYLPNKNGKTKLRVEKDGIYWIAAPRAEWWNRCRLSPEQADYALGKLIKKGLIEKRVFKFGGIPVVHIRLLEQNFLIQLSALIQSPIANPYQPPEEKSAQNSQMEMGNFPNENENSTNPIWENHPEPLTEITSSFPPPPPATASQNGMHLETVYPTTPCEAENHPDIALFRRITGGLFPGKADWRVIIDRIAYIRRNHPELDDACLAEAGRTFWTAWVGRGYSPTHPDWIEWWMNDRIPHQKKSKQKHNSKQDSRAELDAARQRGRELLGPLVQQAHPEA